MKEQLRIGSSGDLGAKREGENKEKGKAINRREAGDRICSGSGSHAPDYTLRGQHHTVHACTHARTRQAKAASKPDGTEGEKKRAGVFALHAPPYKREVRGVKVPP